MTIVRSQALAWQFLLDAASEPYRRGGRFAWHHARGKLARDPVFRHLVSSGLIAPYSRVLDIGCGRGLLTGLVHAAGVTAERGRWPLGWAEPPSGAQVTGIELAPREVERARSAHGDAARFVCGDMRTTDFPPADSVVILDALHYISVADQDAVLARARAALPVGGRLVLRVGDAASRLGYALSLWVDRAIAAARGQRHAKLVGRTLDQWQARLASLGFDVASQPMHRGTPFANVLLVAT
ncbi:MAG: class I SAM-dependent methyltransferase, partial [Caldimonas sp.]